MEAACRGARSAGGTTVGILPGYERSEANAWVDVAIPTGLGEARNALVVRAVFGATPHELQSEARMARACALLRESTLPVTEVCLEVGYRSLGSFSAAFSRRMGCSPRAFRARAAGGQRPDSPHDCFARMC